MANEYELMFEPLPGGWKYGFPRALPKEAVISEDDKLKLNPKFDIVGWVSSFGFPQDAIHKWKVWPKEVEPEDKYIYPGSDCQE